MPDDPEDETILGDKITNSGQGLGPALIIASSILAATAGTLWWLNQNDNTPTPNPPADIPGYQITVQLGLERPRMFPPRSAYIPASLQ